MALDRRREERERERTREAAMGSRQRTDRQAERLRQVPAEPGGRTGVFRERGGDLGRFGSVRLRVVLTQRRLNDLDAIVARSHRTDLRAACEAGAADCAAKCGDFPGARIAAVGAAGTRQAAGLAHTKSQFGSLRKWESASASGVSRDLMILAETATLPYMRPSSVLRTEPRICADQHRRVVDEAGGVGWPLDAELPQMVVQVLVHSAAPLLRG